MFELLVFRTIILVTSNSFITKSICFYNQINLISLIQEFEEYIYSETHYVKDMPLAKDEDELIGTYFSRNYEQGQRVPIPDGLIEDPFNWMLGQQVFLTGKFPYKDYQYSPDIHKPRITLREETEAGDFVSKIFDELVSGSGEIDLDIGALNWGKYGTWDEKSPSTTLLSLGHHEFKVWLQYKIEKIAKGEGSARFLANRKESRGSERTKALDKWDDLTDLIYEIVTDGLFIHNGIKEVRQLGVLHKLISRRHVLPYSPDIGYDQDEDKYADPTYRICRVIVKSLISLSKIKPPPKDYEDLRKQNLLEISLPGVVFLKDSAANIAQVLNDSIGQAYKLEGEFLGPGHEDLELDSKEKALFDEMVLKGFGKRQGSKSLKNASAEESTAHNSVKLSYNILSLLIWEGVLERKKMGWDDYIHHFSSSEDDEKVRPGSNKDYPHLLKFTDKLRNEIIGESTYSHYDNERMHPIYRWLGKEGDRWMYCHPRTPLPQDSIWQGGLIDSRTIVSNHSDYENFETPRCYPNHQAVSALEILQTTQWEINLDLVEALFDIEIGENGALLQGGIREKSSSIIKLKPKEVFDVAFTPKEDVERSKERKTTLDWAKRIIEHNANVFWHSWVFDFRGRMYPRCRQLSPQGDDLDKALIRFKEWRPMGDRGIYWLHVHVHNLFEEIENKKWNNNEAPKKRQSFDDRDRWVADKINLAELRRIAKNPSDKESIRILKLDRFSGGKSESFQRLVAVLELDRVWTEYEEKKDWTEVYSGQPVHLDASTNGYQHLAALLRKQELGECVNILPSTSIQDLYSRVAKKASRIFLGEDYSKELGIELDDDSKNALDKLLFTRGLAKQPTMQMAYGAKRLSQCFDGKGGEGRPKWVRHPKSEGEMESEREAREKIPEEIKNIYNDKYEALEPVYSKDGEPYYFRGKWKWAWFESRVGTKKEAKEIQELLRRWTWRSAWAKDSPLFEAFNSAENLPSQLNGWKDNIHFQNQITKLCVKIYKGAVGEETSGVYKTLGEKFTPLVEKTEKTHDAIIRWTLYDEFEVRNYYIKHLDGGTTSRASPTKKTSTFSKLRPSWLDSQFSGKKILRRLEEVLGKGEFSQLKEKYDLKKYDAAKVEIMMDKVDHSHENSDLNEIRKLLLIRDYSITRYADQEKDRINAPKVKSSISPNFVHSLDSYHMREIIRRMQNGGNIDFWAVHDSFGSHPSRIDALRSIVKKSFNEMYQDRDINTWMKGMGLADWETTDIGTLKIEDVLKSEYMIG